ncbi:HsdM family class I SAM-dependent methyltransferase [Halobacillus sp. B29]|uniref:HsdM family class I SAM-dependent methyltransferase n=1 Tax=Halobacillus sp. B29 TaxID=3457432 RepID=UPI003FCCC479
MKEKDPSTAYVLGIYYDNLERTYLFQRRNGFFLRYDEAKNSKGDESKTGSLSLDISDPYDYLPSYNDLINRVNRPNTITRDKRGVEDLNIIASINTSQSQAALSFVLRSLDKAGLVNQRGYQILIQTLALKIFDEKRNEQYPNRYLEFYVTDQEREFTDLTDERIQTFIERLRNIWEKAEEKYQKILSDQAINWTNINHVRAITAICAAFQDYSFINSARTDLYQLVFYNFANAFTRDESAQFLTPLPVIEFIVDIVNPQSDETVLDPCCGTGDFLSVAFVKSAEKRWKLDDANIFGIDVDESMIMLSTLNMLLNGDGEAKLFHEPDKGSILGKVGYKQGITTPELIPLDLDKHKNGEWDAPFADGSKLKKFDVILTNPPFGDDRAYKPTTKFDRDVIELYDTWNMASRSKIDLGIVFLENAYRSLAEGGRLGIVLSNSFAAVNKYQEVREWLMDKMRIVALFDLPPNVFAEVDVHTTIIIAYKPKKDELDRLSEQSYSVFTKDIQAVGYEKRTRERNKFFNPIYKVNTLDFTVQTDEENRPILDEDFSGTIKDFRAWALGQEDNLKKLFLKGDE